MESSPESYRFKIKFEKEKHSISAETYAKSLVALNTLIKEVNYQSGNNVGEISVEVSAEEEGSFSVTLLIAKLLSSPENIELAIAATGALASVVSAVTGVIGLKKNLGESTKNTVKIEGDNAKVVNGDGNTIFITTKNVYKIYQNNQTVNDAVSEQFQAINDDNEIDAFTIQETDKEPVTFAREDFDELSKKRVIEHKDEATSNVVETLTVSKLALDSPRSKWCFIYRGIPIKAKIEDDIFWDKILNGQEMFANGDRLVCDLEIKRTYDRILGTYVDKEYIVRNVRDHKRRSQLEQLNAL